MTINTIIFHSAMRYQRINLFIIFIFLWSFESASAQFRECGTVISPERLKKELERIAKKEVLIFPPPATYPYHFPLSIHIVRKSDGTGGFRTGQLDTAMQDLNDAFEQASITFFQHGSVDYINSDYYYNVPDVQTRRDSIRKVNVVSNTINVYFSNFSGLCGQASFPGDPVQGIVIDNDCAGVTSNPSSFPHEVGHYFDLYHTHETGFGVECPNGSNCSSAGDLLCDTPADPDLSNRVNSSCVYDNSVATPGGCSGTYAPQTNNLMSYSVKACRTLFTTNQINKMLGAIPTDRTELYVRVKYVDATASGTEDGTPEHPYNTISEAVNAVASGNYVFVRSGNYPSDIITITKKVYMDKWNTGGASVIVGQ